ncbi:MAG: hypothetical protein R2911_29835 [Caldilineaceae bacterium]
MDQHKLPPTFALSASRACRRLTIARAAFGWLTCSSCRGLPWRPRPQDHELLMWLGGAPHLLIERTEILA